MLAMMKKFLCSLLLIGIFFHSANSAQRPEGNAKLVEQYSRIVKFFKDNPNQPFVQFDPQQLKFAKDAMARAQVNSEAAREFGMAQVGKFAQNAPLTYERQIEQIALAQSRNGGDPLVYAGKNDALLFKYQPPAGKPYDITIYSIFFKILSNLDEANSDSTLSKQYRECFKSILIKLRLVDAVFTELQEAVQKKDKHQLKKACEAFLKQ